MGVFLAVHVGLCRRRPVELANLIASLWPKYCVCGVTDVMRLQCISRSVCWSVLATVLTNVRCGRIGLILRARMRTPCARTPVRPRMYSNLFSCATCKCIHFAGVCTGLLECARHNLSTAPSRSRSNQSRKHRRRRRCYEFILKSYAQFQQLHRHLSTQTSTPHTRSPASAFAHVGTSIPVSVQPHVARSNTAKTNPLE